MKYKFKPSHIVPAFLFVVAVLYGGSKPSMPTNAPPLLGVGVQRRSGILSASEQESSLLCTPTPSTFTLKLTKAVSRRWNLVKVTRRGFSPASRV